MRDPINFLDHVVEHPGRFRETNLGDNLVQHDPSPGEIVQEGTPLNAANMNLLDTPGFSAVYVDAEAKELRFLFPELLEREGRCRFTGCLHLKEPDCAVKEDVSRGIIAESRYESYRKLMTELSERRKYK